MRRHVAGVGALVFVAIVASRAQASTITLDDFNRPDAPTLGANWTTQVGSLSIVSDRVENIGAVLTASLATFHGVTSNTVVIDVFAHSGLSYAAAVLGYQDTSNNLYIKVQNNSNSGPALFTNYALYFGVDGTNNVAWSGAIFGSLFSSFSSARMYVTLTGTTVTLALDTDFNGSIDQTYTASAVPVGLLGTQIGIGGLGPAQIDNFSIEVAPTVPEPTSLLLLGTGLAALARRRRRLHD